MWHQTVSVTMSFCWPQRWTHLTLPDNYKVTSSYICVKALYKPHSSILLLPFLTVLVRCAIMYIPNNATPHEAQSVDLVFCDYV